MTMIIKVPLRDIVQAPWQPEGRTDTEIADLAESIRIHGIIEPPIVRLRRWEATDTPSGTKPIYELICGCRRIAAVRCQSDYDPDVEIECILKECTDEEARALAHAENTKRLALAPLDEAADFAALRDERGFGVDKIAAARCTTPKRVKERLALLLLDEEPRSAFVAGRIGEQFAVMLSGLPHEGQRAALKDFDQSALVSQSVRRNLVAIIDRQRRKLADAPFGMQDASLGAEACVLCTRRTGVQGSLFDDESADRCLDAGCFDAKVKLVELRRKEDAKDSADEQPPPKKEASTSTSPTPVKSFEPQAIAEAVEAGYAELARKAASPKRDLSEPKLWQLLAGMLARIDDIDVNDAFERRGSPDNIDGRLNVIGKWSAHECAGFVVEALARLGGRWSGNEKSSQPICAAAKFFKVDLAELRSKALLRLQEEAKPAKTPPSKPASIEEGKPDVPPSPKAIEYSVPCRRCKKGVDVVCKKEGGGFHVERTRDAVAARDGAKPAEQSIVTPPSSSPAFEVDQRVVVVSGPHKGRAGVVETIGDKGIVVKIDPTGRGRPRKPLFNPKELDLEIGTREPIHRADGSIAYPE